MKKLFTHYLLSFCCLTLFFNGVSTANDLCADAELIINEAPTIYIPPVSLCYEVGGITPTTISPIVAGGDGNYTYNWITPATYTGPVNQIEITTSVPGNYILTVTDGNMCSDTEITTVVPNTPPELEIIIISPTTCLGAVIEVMANVTDPDNDDNGTYIYDWSATGSAIVIGDQMATIVTTANTTVTVVVTDSNGCQSTEDLVVTINPPPPFPSNLPAILVCVPGYISSDLTQLDADILANVSNGTVTWYDGNPETTGSPIADPTNVNVPTIFDRIYVQITDNDTGCQNSAQITVFFDSAPVPDAGPDINICTNSLLIQIIGSSLSSGQTATWSWSGNGSNFTDNGNGTAELDATGLAGTFTLTYEVTSQFGCVGSDDRVVTVNSETPVNIFTTDVSDCGESNGTASVSSAAGIAFVEWSNGSSSTTISNLAPGGYAVTVLDNNGCMMTDYALISTELPNEFVEVIVDITRINFPPLGDSGSNTEWALDFDGTAWVFTTPFVGTQGFVELENLLENNSDINCSNIPLEVSLGDYDIANVSTVSTDLTIFESDNLASSFPHSCTYDGSSTNGSNPINSGNGTGDDLLYDGTITFDLTAGSGIITLPLLGGVGNIEIEYVLTCVSQCNLMTGVACDDNNAATLNDVYNDSCECLGTPVAQNFCTDNVLNIIGNPIADGTYDAIQTVISSGVVVNGSTVSHIAGDQVILNPGFTVEPNVYFVADIIPCLDLLTQPEKDDKDKRESQD